MEKELKDLKKRLNGFARGLTITGETREELLGSLGSVHWSLECELDQEKNILQQEIMDMFPEE